MTVEQVTVEQMTVEQVTVERMTVEQVTVERIVNVSISVSVRFYKYFSG